MGGTGSKATPGGHPTGLHEDEMYPTFNFENKYSSLPSRTSPWKFWRRFSLRRSARKSSHKAKKGCLISEPWATIELRHGDANHKSPNDHFQALPDLVDKVGLRRSQSLKAPPKPPRLFLFRRSSTSTPRASVVETVTEKCPPKDANDLLEDLINNKTTTVGNVSDDKEDPLSDFSFLDTSIMDACKEIGINRLAFSNHSNGINSNGDSLLSHSHYSNGTSNQNGDVHVPAARIKIVTPDLNTRKYPTIRARQRSGENRVTDLSAPHRLILQCAEEIICQTLHPAEILDDLHSAGVISSGDLEAFSGHPDRRLICESLIGTLSRNDYSQFLEFCHIIRRVDRCNSLSVLIDAMVAISDLIHSIPENPSDTVDTVPEEDKTISFDIGIFDKTTTSLKPIVELDRIKKEFRKSLREQSLPRASRFSNRSMSDCSPIRDTRAPELPMMSVCISGYSLHGDRSKALASVLDKHHCIHELRVGKTKLTGSDMEHICLAIQNNPGLNILDVRLNNIDNEGATKLGFMMRKCTSIRQLNISSTSIEAVGCKYLCDGLMINAVLKELDLSFVDIGDEGCVGLGEMLTKNCSITKLRLRNNNITWVGCGLIFESLQQNNTLTELDLSRNFVQDRGIEIMCQNVNNARALQDVNLENCGLTVEGCSYLTQTLVMNRTLKHLDLSVNFLGDPGVKILAEILRKTKTLQSLGLNMCGITNDGLVILLDSLLGNHSITLLKLCYNRFGRENVSDSMDADDIRFKMHCVTSSKPKLKILLWGNSLEESG